MTLDECRQQVGEWLSLKLTTGRCSALLVDDLAHHMLNRTLNVFSIYDEIGALEGAPLTHSPSTKSASKFRGPILRDLWHKHYTAPAFIFRNLMNHWTRKRSEALFAGIERNDEVPSDRKCDLLVYSLIMGGYRERHEARGMTGEWIVFAKRDNGNVYLTLARHDEADEEIRKRVDQAAAEFSDLELPV